MAEDPDRRASVELWASFPQDPTDPRNAGLRASDADRERVHRVLGDAYAEGRLDRAEFDERTDAAGRARTLGELPALVSDLLATTAGSSGTALADRAVAAYRRARREAVWGFVSASLICWVIWAVTSGLDSFPWPVFVMLGTGLNLGRVVFMRQDMIAEETRKLERGRARGELPGPED
ncbi:MAG TPA: DUF1707 domain-containing protein [Nocardioides sp.]|uniref:DUF1707 SHOCT-like domain-containing protein n=1 Tax=Nocardioides sp. TaxID=35761 RepID=UPI002B893C0E|nr:DUF1707 domain-containing protein [Nocardioides sp.]HQR28735.1 DUF1707 domain-containing protein [Nocardioides sp.]